MAESHCEYRCRRTQQRETMNDATREGEGALVANRDVGRRDEHEGNRTAFFPTTPGAYKVRGSRVEGLDTRTAPNHAAMEQWSEPDELASNEDAYQDHYGFDATDEPPPLYVSHATLASGGWNTRRRKLRAFAVVASLIAITLWLAVAFGLSDRRSNAIDGNEGSPAPNFAPEGGIVSTSGPSLTPSSVPSLTICDEPNVTRCEEEVNQIPNTVGSSTHLTELSLQVGFSTIPTEVGLLTNLVRLQLHGALMRRIPSEIGHLTNLIQLDMFDNRLTGLIPSEIGLLTNLRELQLFDNALSGTMPYLGSLTSLELLSLELNQLSGSIPSSLGLLAGMRSLYLWRNRLVSSIPSELGLMTNLERLLLSKNALSGALPSEIGRLVSLNTLRLGENQLVGPIPSEIEQLSGLTWLDLHSNQLTGSMPLGLCDTVEPRVNCSLVECSCCQSLDISTNTGEPCT